MLLSELRETHVSDTVSREETVLYLIATLWLHPPTHASCHHQAKDEDGEISTSFIRGGFWSWDAVVDINAGWPPDAQGNGDDRVDQDLQSQMGAFHVGGKRPEPDANEKDWNVVEDDCHISFR